MSAAECFAIASQVLTGHGRTGVPHEVELILTKQLASYLSMPIFLVDPAGNLLFYNEPAEAVARQPLRRDRRDAVGGVGDDLHSRRRRGRPHPPGRAAARHRVSGSAVPPTGSSGSRASTACPRDIAVTAFPLVGQHERALGAVAIFWEQEPGT